MIWTPDEIDMVQRRRFFRHYQDFCDLFGHQAVDEQLEKLSVREIVDLAEVQNPSGAPRETWHRPNMYLGTENRNVTVRHPIDPSFTKNEYRRCDVYLVPNAYQGLSHEKIVRPILMERFPWLSQFEVSIYEFRFHEKAADEIYIKAGPIEGQKNGLDSLYVPVRALLEGDVEAIERRNIEYMQAYTSSRDSTPWDNLRNTEVVQRFLAIVASGDGAKKPTGPKL